MSTSIVAVVATLLLAAAFYAVTAHVAARYVLGEVPLTRALLVGPVPAAVTFLLQQYGVAVVVPVAAVADFLAIRTVYRLECRTAGLVALVHYAVSVILGVTVLALVTLLSTASG